MQDLRRGLGRRDRGESRPGDGLVGAHRGGRLNPHTRVVGFVQRNRNGVDAKEIRRHQHSVHHMVGGQLRQRRHGRQRPGVGGGSSLVLDGRRRAVGTGLRQPGQVRAMRSDVLLGARSLPSTGLYARQYRAQFVGDLGVFSAQR